MQELLFYNGTALSTEEISLLYNSGKARLLEFNPSDRLNSYSKYLVANWKLDEMSGSRYDSTGHVSFTDNNGVDYVDDATFGRCAHIHNSGNKYLSAAGIPAYLKPSDRMTLSLWFNFDSLPGSDVAHYLIYMWDTSTDNYRIALYNSGSAYTLYFMMRQSNGTGKNVSYAIAPSAGTWYHAVLVADGTNLIGYVNGVAGTPTAYDGTMKVPGTSTLYLGTADTNAYTMTGLLTNVQIWNGIALDATAIAQLYNSGLSRAPQYQYNRNAIYGANHLIASWNMQETSGNRIDTRNGYAAVDNGSVGYAAGKTRTNCADFSGSNYLSMSSSTYDVAALIATNNWSIGAWVRVDSTTGDPDFYQTFSSGAPYNGAGLYLQTSTGKIRGLLYSGSTAYAVSALAAASTGTWYRVWQTCNGTAWKLYINGVLQDTNFSWAYTKPSADFIVGGSFVGGAHGTLDGRVQELDILDTAVDEKFIEMDYNSGDGWFYRYS